MKYSIFIPAIFFFLAIYSCEDTISPNMCATHAFYFDGTVSSEHYNSSISKWTDKLDEIIIDLYRIDSVSYFVLGIIDFKEDGGREEVRIRTNGFLSKDQIDYKSIFSPRKLKLEDSLVSSREGYSISYHYYEPVAGNKDSLQGYHYYSHEGEQSDSRLEIDDRSISSISRSTVHYNFSCKLYDINGKYFANIHGFFIADLLHLSTMQE